MNREPLIGADFEVVVTRAGHRAMLHRESGEIMHPVIGPTVEPERLYLAPSRLSARLAEAVAEPLVVLDVGLGAGSNACAALRLAEALREPRRSLSLISFDRTLDALALAVRDEHADDFGFDAVMQERATRVLQSHCEQFSFGSWRLVLGELPTTLESQPTSSADVVFWDPFSPRSNDLLWGLHAFSRLRRLCKIGATVHTYSGATSVRSALLLAGFYVGLAEPLGNNRRATMAATERSALHEPLDARFLYRLRRSSAPFPRDAPAGAFEQLLNHPQFAR